MSDHESRHSPSSIKSSRLYKKSRRRYKLAKAKLECHWLAMRAPQSGSILFIPEVPDHSQFAICKICSYLGYRMTADDSRATAVSIAWENATHRTVSPDGAINGKCTDISKRHVDEAFSEVFGYKLSVSPDTVGRIVQKSDENGAHDGEIVTGPVEVVHGKVYQHVIDNVENGRATDIRIPYFAGQVPFAYLKMRPVTSRFSNQNELVLIKPVDEVLNDQELAKIPAFCERMGLDYGELDIARDAASGLIYILDVNNTPAGPPNGLQAASYKYALEEMARSFKEAFLGKP